MVVSGSGKQLFSDVKYKQKYINDIDVRQRFYLGKRALFKKIRSLVRKIEKDHTIAFLDLKCGVKRGYRSKIERLQKMAVKDMTRTDFVRLERYRKDGFYHWDEDDVKSKDIVRYVRPHDLIKLDIVFFNKDRYMEMSNIYVLTDIESDAIKNLQVEIFTDLYLKRYYKCIKRLFSYYKAMGKFNKRIFNFLNGKAGLLNYKINRYKANVMAFSKGLPKMDIKTEKVSKVVEYKNAVEQLSQEFLNDFYDVH